MRRHALSILCSTILLTAPVHAQSLEPVETLGDYEILRVTASKVCFAVYKGKSANELDITYATFKTKSGDRWQVLSYVYDEKLKALGDLLTIRFDGKLTLSRAVEISRGDLILPFTEDEELADFDAGVAAADEVTFQLKNLNDTITVDLPALRTAKAGIDACLEAIT